LIIKARHRNERLALRHLARLKRQWNYAEIDSRRNSRGHFSARGQVWWYEVRNFDKQLEIVLHFDYVSGSKKKGKKDIRFQVHVIGPKGATDAEAIRAVRQRSATGAWAKGWKHKAIFWGRTRDENPHQTKPLPPELRAAALAVGESRVVRRSEVRSNRSSRKDLKK
jgi:hypothetical protein